MNDCLFLAIKVTATHTRIVSTIAKTSEMATVHMARSTSPYTSSSSDTDSIIASNNVPPPTGTALRRLYFRAAKSGKTITTPKNSSTANVPKVIVMNSSCNSTINTSTESASTHFTNITTTTDTETCDSLDMGKIHL